MKIHLLGRLLMMKKILMSISTLKGDYTRSFIYFSLELISRQQMAGTIGGIMDRCIMARITVTLNYGLNLSGSRT